MAATEAETTSAGRATRSEAERVYDILERTVRAAPEARAPFVEAIGPHLRARSGERHRLTSPLADDLWFRTALTSPAYTVASTTLACDLEVTLACVDANAELAALNAQATLEELESEPGPPPCDVAGHEPGSAIASRASGRPVLRVCCRRCPETWVEDLDGR